jgi:hypothetical protein
MIQGAPSGPSISQLKVMPFALIRVGPTPSMSQVYRSIGRLAPHRVDLPARGQPEMLAISALAPAAPEGSRENRMA